MGIRQIQTNFTSGVFDPLLIAREDLVYYQNGLEDGLNLLVLAQGGVTGRPGMRHVMEIAPPLAAISLSGATVTAPAGGTAANISDGDAATYVTTSGNLGTTDPVVLVHVDFGTAQAVTAVDVLNIRLSAGSLAGEIYVQYSTDDAAWQDFGAAIDVDAADRSRRRRAEAAVSARYWRLARVGDTATAATLSAAELKFWGAAAGLSNVRLLPFAYSTEQSYMMVLTDRNMDVLAGDERTAAVAIPHTSSQVSVVNPAQKLDTMLLYHKDVRTQRIFRQGGDDEFDFRDLTRTNIPQYDYGAGTGGADCVQFLSVDALSTSDIFTLELEGENTTAITVNSDPAVTAASMQAALRGLANTSSDGITVTNETGGFEVTFGGDDGKRPWLKLSIFVLHGSSVWDVAITTKGQPQGEDIMSDTRGWPRCGAFYQGRLHEGGIKSAPHVWLASTLDDYYDFNIDVDDDSRALMFRADTDQVSAIYQIVPARDLSFFTNDSEFYNTKEPIDVSAVMKLATRAGSKEGLPVYDVDGALLFLQGVKDPVTGLEVATSVREMIYDISVQNYQANILSTLSSNLVKDPVDMALRKALSTGEADILLMVHADGTGTAYTVQRTQNVNAFMPVATRTGDKMLAARADARRRVYFAVERVINGEARRFIEMWDDDLLLDGGGRETMTYEEVTAAADGQAVYAWAFDNPATAEEIIVRLNGGRLEPGDYAVDLGDKEVTLSDAVAATVAAGDTVRIAYGVKVITGLSHLAGETVQTVIDGTQGDDAAVSVEGVLTLPDYADTEIQYGFDFEVYGKMMPFRVPGADTLAGRKLRNVSSVLSLYRTGGIELRVNGGAWKPVALAQLDSEVLDRSTAELGFTGEKIIRGHLGAAIGAPYEFRRPGPCRFTVRAITREVMV